MGRAGRSPVSGDVSAAQLTLELEPPEGRAAAFLGGLQSLGMVGVASCVFTRNSSTMASLSRGRLRVHESFWSAPEPVLHAIVTFFTARRGENRRSAKQTLIEFSRPTPRTAPRPRSRGSRAALSPALQEALARAERALEELHVQLNERHFGGTLRAVAPQISLRMKTRLGHYSPGAGGEAGSAPSTGEIVISWRHVRRNGMTRAAETLLHEMVHQWQHESGLPLDHGSSFRKKAREVGIPPCAVQPRDYL